MKSQPLDQPSSKLQDGRQGADDSAQVSDRDRGMKPWKVGGVFWGTLCILTGILILCDNLGIISIYLERIWFLWPVVIIGIGISLLSACSVLARIFLMLFSLVVCSLVAYVLISPQLNTLESNNLPQEVIVSPTTKDIRSAEIVVDAGAARINLTSDKNVSLVKADLESDWLSLQQSSTRRDDVQTVTISTDTKRMFWIGNYRNELDVALGRTLPTSMTIKAGASQLKGDISDVRLSRLVLKMGASDIDLRIGDRLARQDIDIDAGASNIVLHVPARVGVRLHNQSGLTRVDVQDIKKVSDTLYESEQFADSDNQIVIVAKLGVSNFTIRRY